LSEFHSTIVTEKKDVIVNLVSAFCGDLSESFSLIFDQANVKILAYPVPHWSKRYSEEKPTPGVIANFSNLNLVSGRGVGTWKFQ
jgi:hypothetical protein